MSRLQPKAGYPAVYNATPPIYTDQMGAALQTDKNGNLKTSDSFVGGAYDYIGVTYPDAVTEVYTYKMGGSGGTTIATVTVVYTDSTKANLSSTTRS